MSTSKFNLDKLLKFLADNQNTFQLSFLTLLAGGGEQLFQSVTFTCPCDPSRARQYSLWFFLTPAFVLLLLGILLNKDTWYHCHGCWQRGRAGCALFLQFTEIAFKASVVPFVWSFVALLDGRYYACLYASAPCNTTSPEYEVLRSQSVIYGWITMATFMAVAVLVISIRRCFCTSKSYIEKQYSDMLKSTEEVKMKEIFKTNAEKIGKANAEYFLAEDAPALDGEGFILTTHCLQQTDKREQVRVTAPEAARNNANRHQELLAVN